jgi:hypothetical protein
MAVKPCIELCNVNGGSRISHRGACMSTLRNYLNPDAPHVIPGGSDNELWCSPNIWGLLPYPLGSYKCVPSKIGEIGAFPDVAILRSNVDDTSRWSQTESSIQKSPQSRHELTC